MYSLTGFGKCITEKEGRKVICELKSVNHRFLDISFRMPKIFNIAEDGMRKIISTMLSRGHIEVFVTYEDNRGDKAKIAINESVAALYVDASNKLSKTYGLQNNFGVADLLRSPDCISMSMNEDDEALLAELIIEATKGACGKLLIMRENEGDSLRIDMSSRIAAMKEALEQIRIIAPTVVTEYSAKLKKRIVEMLSDVSIDETRLLNEVAFFTDKCNIDEEITRLSAHLNNAEKYMSEKEPLGRKLDFLSQEMNREINTIGSKAQDLAITNHVVFLKNELEKIREQVQNVE